VLGWPLGEELGTELGEEDGIMLGSALGSALGEKEGAEDGLVLGADAALVPGKSIRSPPTPLKPYMKVFGALSLTQLPADIFQESKREDLQGGKVE
jgi:hypothetical protein